MSLKFLKETFTELVAVDSPFGFEEPMIRHFKEALVPYVDEVIETPPWKRRRCPAGNRP